MEKLEQLLSLERSMREAQAAVIFGVDPAVRFQAREEQERVRPAMWAAYDALTTTEAVQYGEFRKGMYR